MYGICTVIFNTQSPITFLGSVLRVARSLTPAKVRHYSCARYDTDSLMVADEHKVYCFRSEDISNSFI